MVNQFLSLSLFVMLLSFFIILTSMSSFEVTKAEPVLKSLSLAFSDNEPDPGLEVSLQESIDESYREGATLERLSGLFSARIRGATIEKNRLGTVMMVRMSLSDFSENILKDERGSGQVSLGGQAPLLPMLVSLLQTQDNKPYRMDMVLNLDDNPANVQNDVPDTLLSSLKTIASYAQAIERAGLPKNMVSAGLGKGPNETIDLYFRRYVPFNPQGKGAL